MIHQKYFCPFFKTILLGLLNLCLALVSTSCTKGTLALQGNNASTVASGSSENTSPFSGGGTLGSPGTVGTTGNVGSTGSGYQVALTANPSSYASVGTQILLTANANFFGNATFQFSIVSGSVNASLIPYGNTQVQVTSPVADTIVVKATLFVAGSSVASTTLPLNFYVANAGGAIPILGGYPTLSGTWYFGGKPCSIKQTGTSLSFTNEVGNVADGTFTSEHSIVATDWGNLTGTLSADYQTINWANATTWTRVSGNGVPLLLASNFVAPLESNASASPTTTNLATPDAVSFVLPVPTTAFIYYTAVVNGSGTSSGDCFDGLVIDGSPVSINSVSQTYNSEHHFDFAYPLGAGFHSISVSHATNNGLTCGWRNRMLSVLGANSSNPIVIANSFLNGAGSTAAQAPSYVNLPTPDALSFNLSATTVALIQYSAVAYLNSTSTGGDCYDSLNIDGTPVSLRSVSSLPSGNAEHNLSYSVSLAAGAHTVSVLHAANNSLSCTWSHRMFSILGLNIASAPLLASQYIPQNEATTTQQGDFVDLATPDAVSFTLSQTSMAVISYGANAYLQGSQASDCYDALYIDGGLIYSTSSSQTGAANGEHSLSYAAPLTPGTHTVAVRHSANNGAVCSFSARLLTVLKGN